MRIANPATTVVFYHPEDGDGMFSEMVGVTRATQSNIPEDIRHCYRCGNIPDDGVLRLYIVSPSGVAYQQ
jgi:hypothetical protein